MLTSVLALRLRSALRSTGVCPAQFTLPAQTAETMRFRGRTE